MRVYLRDGSALTIFSCCHTEIEVADQTFHLTQPSSPSADPITSGAWQGSYWSASFSVTGMTTPEKSRRKRDSNPESSALQADALPLSQRGGRLGKSRRAKVVFDLRFAALGADDLQLGH